MRATQFGPRGRLTSATTVWVSRPGLPAPYVLGQVRFEGGPQVVCHVRDLDAESALPIDVQLEFALLDDAVPLFWCRPLTNPHAAR